jgi:hypothetical protein
MIFKAHVKALRPREVRTQTVLGQKRLDLA